MAKTIWVVRVQNNPINGTGVPRDFLECLRYAGIAKIDSGSFDLYPPKGTGDTKIWAEQNASRMITHGFVAAVVRAGSPLSR